MFQNKRMSGGVGDRSFTPVLPTILILNSLSSIDAHTHTYAIIHVHKSLYTSVHLSVCLSVYLSVCLSVSPYSLSVCLFVSPYSLSVRPPVSLFVHQPVWPSVYQYIKRHYVSKLINVWRSCGVETSRPYSLQS
jgi:hypothetical protein